MKTFEELKEELKLNIESTDVYVFECVLSDNRRDRDGDLVSTAALIQLGELLKNSTGLIEHEWNSDSAIGRIIDTEIEVHEDEQNEIGEPYAQLIGLCYILKNTDLYEKVLAGVVEGISIAFTTARQSRRDDIDTNVIEEISDAYEWSLVAVPANKSAGIRHKFFKLGGRRNMKKSFAKLKSLVCSGDAENPDELLKELTDETPLSDDEIAAIIAENESLKKEVARLNDELADIKGDIEKKSLEDSITAAIAEACPLTPDVAVIAENEIKSLLDEGSTVEDAVAAIVAKYPTLFTKVCKSEEQTDNTTDAETTPVAETENPEAAAEKSEEDVVASHEENSDETKEHTCNTVSKAADENAKPVSFKSLGFTSTAKQSNEKPGLQKCVITL